MDDKDRIKELEAELREAHVKASKIITAMNEERSKARLASAMLLQADKENKELEAQLQHEREGAESFERDLDKAVMDRRELEAACAVILRRWDAGCDPCRACEQPAMELVAADGRKILERVKKLERVADAARQVVQRGYCGEDASRLDTAVTALNALEEKP